MSWASSLVNNMQTLILDTSVLINLHACSSGKQILAAVPNAKTVAKIVVYELENETSRNIGQHGFLQDLLSENIVTAVDLTDVELEMFASLTSIPPSLDDGEAATIAIASSRAFLPIIDERKGRSRASSMMPGINAGWSLDLLLNAWVVSELGEATTAEAVYRALRHGRMRIPSEAADYVIELIGRDRARECTCLPSYRERFAHSNIYA